MPNRPKSPVLSEIMVFPGSSITWAGASPLEHDLCFGTEEGQIWFADLGRVAGPLTSDSRVSGSTMPGFTITEEAVNGVAFTPDLMAVSTRSEITFARWTAGPPAQFHLNGEYAGGAHGVIATPGGVLAAPLGPDGLLLVEPTGAGAYSRRRLRAEGIEISFYRIAHLGVDRGGRDVYAAAGRDAGAMEVVIDAGGGPGEITASSDPRHPLDVVDVCSLPSVSHPFASASLGIDNAIYLSRGIVGDRAPVCLRFADLRGTAYSIASAAGHLFLLTSEALYTFPDLVSGYLDGDRLHRRRGVSRISVDPIDMALVYGSHVLLTLDEGIAKFEIDQLVMRGGGPSWADFEALDMIPDVEDVPWATAGGSPLELVAVG